MTSRDTALQLTKVDLDAHAASKLRGPAATLEALRAVIDTGYATFRRSA